MFNLKLILEFLKKLEDNNNKRWFDANRPEYQTAREEWLKMTEYMLGELGDIYPDFYEQDPRKCIFRINRDVRFSKNKQPYKNNFGMHFVPGGKKSGNAGFYFHLEPGNCFIGVGLFGPESDTLFKIRTYLLTHYKKLNKIFAQTGSEDKFHQGYNAKLKRPPRGFDKDHPAIEWLKYKRFIIIKNFTEKEVMNKKFEQKIASRFHELAPIAHFLNQARQ